MNVQIVSTGSYVPGDPITNEQIEALVGPIPADTLSAIGIQRRYWMADPNTGEHRETHSDMAFKAAQRALDAAGLEAEQIGLIVVSTGSPEYQLPPMVMQVRDKLGCKRCAVLELRSGGAGIVQGLDLARLYLEQGTFENALVIGSEAVSPLQVAAFSGREPGSVRLRDRLIPYMFGDGAGAVLLGTSENGEGILGTAISSIGGHEKLGMRIMGGATHAPLQTQQKATQLMSIQVDFLEVCRFAPQMMEEAISAVLERTHLTTEAIDLYVIPEGDAKWMLDGLRQAGLETSEWTLLESKIYNVLSEMGAPGSAGLPIALDRAWRTGRVQAGDRILLLGMETSGWAYAAMTLTWSAAPWSGSS